MKFVFEVITHICALAVMPAIAAIEQSPLPFISVGVLVGIAIIKLIRKHGRQFKFIPQLGVYQDKKTGIYYCPRCLRDQREAPLKETANGLACIHCGKPYRPRKEVLKSLIASRASHL